MGIDFEFINGPLDGKFVSVLSTEPRDARLARFLKIATGGGTAGRWFRGLTPELLSETELKRVPAREITSLIFEVAGRKQLDDRVVIHIRQRR